MAGFIKGSDPWKQKMIGLVCDDLKAIHDKCPEAHDEIVKLSQHISHIINVSMLGNTNHKMKDDMFEKHLEQ